ncbi:hypothetical protein TBLA_0A07520 [Henningerozyma blattae CBS 6284]|uniref:protein disulfide-isomerase n=1 Tax=Henningerozyma blattae (strain ATCC 34711 / CBS 6284 / DSM 70876 / NBRC 10599 / NRRL Y-10934 / UCD 77-7) TaxID=1071380 RepID=I2GWP0_HENB6|nr:hypothetical protein TBLA_0A07520 [Tetrapisispora blattae CBS 6284]CCH58542.1 hypothetical protein TBLA_0A07520 [Tetrapisispora blattae CBS 6284]
MRFSKFSLLASVLYSITPALGSAIAPEDSKVIQLNANNFDETVKGTKLTMVEFFAPWCFYSNAMINEYVNAANSLNSDDILFTQVNCESEENIEFCENMEIDVYPTIKIFRNINIEEPLDFVGHRTADNFITTLQSLLSAPVTIINSDEELQNFIDNSDKTIIANIGGIEGLNETFYEAAQNNTLDFDFILYPKENITEAEKELLVYVKEDDPEYDGSYSVASYPSYSFYKLVANKELLMVWVNGQTLPVIGELNGENFMYYVNGNTPLAYLFYVVREEFMDYLSVLKPLAMKYRHQLNFVGVDALKFGKQVENLNLLPNFPLFAIHNMTNNRKYSFDQISPEEYANITEPLKIDHNDIRDLVEKFMNGTADPVIGTEPVPETQENTFVYQLVGTTHDDFVRDNERDIIVNYYSPWDEGSKQTNPLFDKAAELLYPYSDKIGFAKINAFNNDILSVNVDKFPTIALYPAGSNGTEIIYFNTSKSVEHFCDFAEEYSKNDIPGKSVFAEYKKKVFKETDVEGDLAINEDPEQVVVNAGEPVDESAKEVEQLEELVQESDPAQVSEAAQESEPVQEQVLEQVQEVPEFQESDDIKVEQAQTQAEESVSEAVEIQDEL